MNKLDTHTAAALLGELLAKLQSLSFPNDCSYLDWQIERIHGGKNNLLYRAKGQSVDLAIKFCIPDDRDRAGREYQSLAALQEASIKIAPIPILLDRNSYQYPVIVQTWLAGMVTETPPDNDLEWLKLLEHFRAIHQALSPSQVRELPQAALMMTDPRQAIEQVEKQFSLIPEPNQNNTLKELLEKVRSRRFPEWRAPLMGLCRCDPNPLNFIRRPGIWCSVDWENSGWGDPAFEIADLMAHPKYLTVDKARGDWLIEAYTGRISDQEIAKRIRFYYQLMIAWWIFRLNRELHTPKKILADRAAGWEKEIADNLRRYMSILNF